MASFVREDFPGAGSEGDRVIAETPQGEGEGPRVLLVDDNEGLLAVCVRALAGHGFRVEAAQDGESALRALRRNSFDVLVTDVEMPGMSGLELVKQIRIEGMDIPTVLVTGNPTLDSAMEAMVHGVLRYLPKPVRPSALVATVNDAVRLHGIARAERLALDNDALHSLVEELRRSKDAAFAGTRAKTELLSRMGHELRTPMSAVIGMTDLALAADLAPAVREYLGVVKASANSLMETIAHVLDFSDLDAGRLQLEPTPFSPREVIDAILEQLRPLAGSKGLSLSSDVTPEVPEVVIGDPLRLGMVLKALIGNAIKFTATGNIGIATRVEAGDGREVRLSVSISDQGIGIPKEAAKRVVEAFSQQDGSSTRQYQGAGLGLSIASQLVALMHGSLNIESTPGVGTTVRFIVCFEPVPADDGFFMMDSHAP